MATGVKVSKLNFELNPRGNLWYNDEGAFGHKLLAKMGWSKGKGLGKNEDGIKENIKIYKKETNTGVGWKNDEIPVATGCLEYESILQNLQKHFNKNLKKPKTEETFEKSLEQRSRVARNHLHYQKFVRGKDLIRYSEKDMKCIFLEKPQKPVSDHPSHLPNETPTFNSHLSMNDYFALKMQKKKEEAEKSKPKVTSGNSISEEPQQICKKPSKKRKLIAEMETPKKAKLHTAYFYHETSNLLSNEDHAADKSSQSDEINKGKKKKSRKNKSRLQQLKSCLKTQKNYNLEEIRNVSFNEQVSYKILDTSLELSEEINDLNDDDQAIDVAENEQLPLHGDCDEREEDIVENGDEVDEKVSFMKEKDIFTKKKEIFTSDEERESGVDEQRPPPCFDLPKCSGSNFNFWLESQRQASKMELYKEMVKKIRKNKILRSTNLLDIKGYGNWGL